MVTALPTFKGWTIDQRLGEFRKVSFVKGQPKMEFVKMSSAKGRKLASSMNKR
jgi:hypothetical protein